MAILALGCALLLGACGGHKSGEAADAGSAKGLNLYIFSDDLAQDTLSAFEKATGIKVHVAYSDTNETGATQHRSLLAYLPSR